MLTRFLCTIFNFVVTLIGIRSGFSICLLDAPPTPARTLDISFPINTYKLISEFNTDPTKAFWSHTYNRKPLPTTFGKVTYAPRTPHLKTMVDPSIIDEPEFAYKSIALIYHHEEKDENTHSIYDLPPSTTLAVSFAPSGEFSLVKYEPGKKGLFEDFVTECWKFVIAVLKVLYWAAILSTSGYVWVKYIL